MARRRNGSRFGGSMDLSNFSSAVAGLGLSQLANTTGRPTFSGMFSGDLREAVSTGLSKVPFFGGLMSAASDVMKRR